jgi:hypothetical protein
MFRRAGSMLAVCVIGVSTVSAQAVLIELMQRHGVDVKAGLEAAFDAHAVPSVAITPGSVATPLGMLTTSKGNDRINAAYAFGILAGRSGRAAAPQELAAAGPALVAMIGSDDARSRIAGARVGGRVFAAPYDRSPGPSVPAGMIDALFAVFNRSSDVDQLVAMDALGLLRERTAVPGLTERYQFYRDANQRALAGGALEALARIGEPSAADLVRQVAADKWSAGNDPTALAVAFARERVLKDGSIALIQHALSNPRLRDQARGYLDELGVP